MTTVQLWRLPSPRALAIPLLVKLFQQTMIRLIRIQHLITRKQTLSVSSLPRATPLPGKNSVIIYQARVVDLR